MRWGSGRRRSGCTRRWWRGRRRSSGRPTYTETLLTKGNLALLLQGMGELAEARRLYE